MPHFCKCGSCRASFSDGDRHILCISCLGRNHADHALSKGGCPECDDMSMATLRAHLASFDMDPVPLLLSSGPRCKKRHSQRRLEDIPESARMPANSPCASLSVSPSSITAGQPPAVHRESDGDNAEEDSCSLLASESEVWSGSNLDPAPSTQESSVVRSSFDAELLCLLTQAVEDLCLDWSLPEQAGWLVPARAILDASREARSLPAGTP